ncbi:carbohydrate sulfotransferase 1-like isoform X2 [Panulirus ornatus]
MPRNLLVTSVGRSGSSFFGELLASHGGNIYFFEPVRALKQSFHNETLVRAEILRTFHCDIRQELINLDKYPYENIKHNYTRGKNKDEIELSKLNQICMKEPLRIVKSIRSRLSWTKQLLDEEDLDLKVIHLVRDPRGTYLSMAKVRWDVTPRSVCDKVLQDLKEREVMERLYPDRYFFVKYEDICRDPYGQARAIFRFLRGELNGQNKYSDDHLNHRDDPSLHDATKGGPMLPHQSKAEDKVALARVQTKTKRRLDPGSFSDLPKGVLAYLQSHTRVNVFAKKSPWTTVRDTPSIYQSWRKTITQMELTYLETQCREVIQTLRHRLFGTVDTARNLSISLSEDPEIPILQKQETL